MVIYIIINRYATFCSYFSIVQIYTFKINNQVLKKSVGHNRVFPMSIAKGWHKASGVRIRLYPHCPNR